jgi:hypothetical protein
MTDVEALLQAVVEFVNTEDWEAAQRVLEAHPELLSPEADTAFEGFILAAEERNEPEIVRHLTMHRDLLRTCRESGVEEAFRRLADSPDESDVLDAIANNTIAVMTDRPDRREEWFGVVQGIQAQAEEHDFAPMVALLDAITRLLMGESPNEIAPKLEGPYAACWERIVEALGRTLG